MLKEPLLTDTQLTHTYKPHASTHTPIIYHSIGLALGNTEVRFWIAALSSGLVAIT